MRGLADLGQPQLAVEHFRGDRLGSLPHVGFTHDVRNPVAGEGELAMQTTMRVLVDDPADGVGIFAGEHAIEHHLGHCHLAAHGLAARLEVDRLGQAYLRLRAGRLVEAEQLGRGHRPLVLAGHLAFGRNRLSAARAVLHHDARIGGQRRQIRPLYRRVENASGLAGGEGNRWHGRELDVGAVARRDVGSLESRFFSRRPRLDRAELFPHRVDAEKDPRCAPRCVRIGGGKREPADRLSDCLARRLALDGRGAWRIGLRRGEHGVG